MSEEWILPNGIDGRTGKVIGDPVRLARAVAAALGASAGGKRRWLGQLTRLFGRRQLGLPIGVDPLDLAQAGWAVVFHSDESAAVREALAPLIARRQRQAGEERTRILEYRTGQSWLDWLGEHRVTAGTVRPERVPYYLLLAGDPVRIPYSFQHHLAIEYAVGRVAFSQPDSYRRYAESLVGYETDAAVPTRRAAAFFAPSHDAATELSAGLLVQSLVTRIPEKQGFAVRSLRGDRATRARLEEIVGAPSGDAPAFLFSASHGLVFKAGDPDQPTRQGALLCQPEAGEADPVRDSFGAAEIDGRARVHGLIAFLFACYGAGTPQDDEFLHPPDSPPPEVAPRPFVAALPRALLSHPGGGALAVIGHVDRAWSCSLQSRQGHPQLLPFENTVEGLLSGWPVGHAVRDFRQRFAVLSTQISEILEKRVRFGLDIPENQQESLALAWIERNDARNYAVLGDPAARLRVEAMSAASAASEEG